MSAPELPGQSLVFAQQLTGCLPFEPLDELGDGEVRRHRHEKMQVVFGNVALDNLNIHGLADLPDQVSHPNRYLSGEHWLAVFGDPYHVKFDVINSVRGLAVVLHNTASLLKSSPKGEGFSPIPRGGH
jgi:hypothetical protein